MRLARTGDDATLVTHGTAGVLAGPSNNNKSDGSAILRGRALLPRPPPIRFALRLPGPGGVLPIERVLSSPHEPAMDSVAITSIADKLAGLKPACRKERTSE